MRVCQLLVGFFRAVMFLKLAAKVLVCACKKFNHALKELLTFRRSTAQQNMQAAVIGCKITRRIGA